jgi:hypothetical protein
MTPEQQRATLDTLSAAVQIAANEAFEALIQLIREGSTPRDAVEAVMKDLDDDVAKALEVALVASIGSASAQPMMHEVRVELSRRLYAYGADSSATVTRLVTTHVQGFNNARELAREIFEGYRFRAPESEPIQLNPKNPQLPKYLGDVLQGSPGVQRDLQRAFAQMQVKNLQTSDLRAAYSDVLRAIDAAEAQRGFEALQRRIKVAFYERMRYFANRIAQTEIHRAYIKDEAARLMQDTDVEYVQIRRAPGRQTPCICSLYTGRDKYGLGPGVYPKAVAPRPPLHPFCRCVVAPRLDLSGKKAKPESDTADRYFLDRVGESTAARIVGSRAKLDLVQKGAKPDDVYNAGLSPQYRVKQLADK